MTVVADIANLVRDGKVDAALSLQLTREDPLYRSIDGLVQLVVDKENEAMRALRASVDAANRRSLVAMGDAGRWPPSCWPSSAASSSRGRSSCPCRPPHAFLSDVAAGRLRRHRAGHEPRRVRRAGRAA